MTNTAKSVLVVGVTGNVGYACCKQLARYKDRFDRIVVFKNTLCTSLSKDNIVKELASMGFEIISSDTYDNSELYEGFDTVIIAINSLGTLRT